MVDDAGSATLGDRDVFEVAQKCHEYTGEFSGGEREAGKDECAASATTVYGFSLRATRDGSQNNRAKSSGALRHGIGQQRAGGSGATAGCVAESSSGVQRAAIRYGAG